MTVRLPEGPPTIYDVAKAAGLSHQTVSRYIQGQRVSERSRVRIESSIEALGFRPNATARVLATRRSHRIGALTHEMTQLGPMMALEGASAAARRAGYVLDIVNLNPFDSRSTREAVALINQHDLAGILAFSSSDAVTQRLEETNFHIPVYFEARHDGQDETSLDHRVGVLAAEHLLDLGHRDIAHISGPLDWPAARQRTHGFTARLKNDGLDLIASSEGNWSTRSGFAAAQAILDSSPDVTAIFAANDQMAIGAISALARCGIRIPDSVSVMGVDDIQESEFTVPPLTTVPMHFAEQGEFALHALLALIRNEEAPEPFPLDRIMVTHRDATGPAPTR